MNNFIEFSFSKIVTEINNGDEKKQLKGIPPKWSTFQKSYISPKDKARAIPVSGKSSDPWDRRHPKTLLFL
jgi:hypothetical protein